MLGPFCGKPACTEIKVGRGVCGTAFSSGKALIVPNVEEFPGHIACDSASRSEMVIPLPGVGVFDLDSPSLGRFSSEDQRQVSEWLALLKLPSGRPWA